MSSRALITGAAGFVGKALAAHLVSEGVDVHGVDLPGHARPEGWSGSWHAGDVTDARQIRALFGAVHPDYVFHLAALLGDRPLEALLAVNVIGTQHVLEAAAAAATRCRVLVAGSAAEYGLARTEELPIREDNPLRPVTAYGVSKLAQSVLAARYVHTHALPLIRTRTFNLTGPAEPDSLVCAGIAKRIVDIERGARAPKLVLRGLDSRRDFVDVRDAVRAYWLLAQHGEPGEAYNVCSGIGTSISRVLELLLALSTATIVVESRTEPATTDVPFQLGSPEKTFAATGWRPSIPLGESLASLLRTRRTLTPPAPANDRENELDGPGA